MRVTITLNVPEGDPRATRMLDILISVAAKLNGTVTRNRKATK